VFDGSVAGQIEECLRIMPSQKVLVVEDDHALNEILVYNLQKEGYEVLTATDGQQGLAKAQTALPDLIVLDLMLPVVDGITICRQIRSDARTKHIRILMLTAKGEEVDEIVGFSMGADDYVTKPFKVKPLMSRIQALLRRSAPSSASQDVVSIHGIEINRVEHVCRVSGQEVTLTPTEFNLLWTLARQPGRTYSRLELLDLCRGEDANALERTIDVHIRALRIKLGELADVIGTVRGVGYRMVSEWKGKTATPVE
jgi:two-component system phosphate regulon response regulator PhoB